jgi:hypothetical protein
MRYICELCSESCARPLAGPPGLSTRSPVVAIFKRSGNYLNASVSAQLSQVRFRKVLRPGLNAQTSGSGAKGHADQLMIGCPASSSVLQIQPDLKSKDFT